MSKSGDDEYKPRKQLLKKTIPGSRDRPVRSTRSTADYREVVVITDSEEESVLGDSQGVVEHSECGRLTDITFHGKWSDRSSVGTIKSEACWSPQTLSKKTDSIINNLSEL